MYKLYEKVPKSNEFEYGMKMVEEDENPFKNGPCLLSMIAIAQWEKDINGALNQGMEVLRLKTTHNENSGIKLEDFGGKILSLSYGEPSEKAGIKGRKLTKNISRTESLDDEFTKKYLIPLIEENGAKIDVLQAMKNLRNVNIMTYCSATQSALRMEECLAEKMDELGYSESEISKILSQICIVGYATDVIMRTEVFDKKNIRSTHFSFGDVYDGDVSASKILQENVQRNNTIYDSGYYFHAGIGEHSLKYYTIQNDSLSMGISNVLTKAMSNSIANYKSEQFIPLSRELLTENITEIIEGVQQGKNKSELVHLIDDGMDYSIEGKYMEITEQEIGKATINIPTNQKDETIAKIQKDQREIQQNQEHTKAQNNNIN